MIKHALNYLSKGKSIIPVGQDKIPLIHWKEFQTRLPTEQEITEWWTKYPEANIGLVTGKISQITVVDVEKGGNWEQFPPTVTIQTGGGGWHLYYDYAPFDNKARIFPLTDIRGDGGYVVAPPSIHKSGNPYKVLINYKNHAPFPSDLFGGKKQTDWDSVTGGVGKGNRNDSASRMVGKLLRAFPKEQWETAVWPLVESWNSRNSPPLGQRELRNVFQSICKRAVSNVALYDNEPEEIIARTFTEVVEAGAKELIATRPEDIVSLCYPWLDEKLTGLFKGELVIVGGETGSGKTTFVTNIVYKASKTTRATVFALEDRMNDYGIKALYFKIGEIRKRENLPYYPWNDYRKNIIKDLEFSRILEQAKQELRNDNLIFIESSKRMSIETLEKAIEEQLLQGSQLFVVDHLHYFDLLRGKSSKADYIEELMVRLKHFQNRTGARIIMVVHYRKTNGQKPTLDSFKDSIAIVQNANYVINLWRDRSDNADLTKTTFMIPKARNPNGEATIEVDWDKTINDYKPIGEWTAGTYQEESVVVPKDYF